jgi:uncharacterized integral membrane protein
MKSFSMAACYHLNNKDCEPFMQHKRAAAVPKQTLAEQAYQIVAYTKDMRAHILRGVSLAVVAMICYGIYTLCYTIYQVVMPGIVKILFSFVLAFLVLFAVYFTKVLKKHDILPPAVKKSLLSIGSFAWAQFASLFGMTFIAGLWSLGVHANPILLISAFFFYLLALLARSFVALLE